MAFFNTDAELAETALFHVHQTRGFSQSTMEIDIALVKYCVAMIICYQYPITL